jgi:hypothetical protein
MPRLSRLLPNYEWYIENNPHKNALEIARVVSRSQTRLTLSISHPLEGTTETKVFDIVCGELQSTETDEPTTNRTSQSGC